MQSNAVLQFETWSREENSFRVASLNANRERKRIEESLSQLRLLQKQLSNDARQSADLLGRLHRDCGLLEQEKERLQQQLKDERAMLELCSRDAEELLHKGTLAKTEYRRKIESIQTDLTELLHQQEDQFLHTIISVETVAALQEFMVELNSGNKNEKNDEFLDTLVAWTAVATSHENSMAEIGSVTKNVKSLRLIAMEILIGNDINHVTESLMDEMERSWEDKIDCEFMYGHPPSSQDDSTVA